MNSTIKLLITIDTEGDNLWSKPSIIEAKNSRAIPRFQELCEKYKLKPTYLTNYEIATDEFFIEYGRDLISRNTAEIGMHLHAWNSPPEYNITENDYKNQPYLIEYPAHILSEKIKIMTDILENNFLVKMKSHRAGRWAFNEYYAKTLIEYGYEVDCSITPKVSWKNHKGSPTGGGGTDYINFPCKPYLINIEDISKEGNTSLLEVPMTIAHIHNIKGLNFLRSIRGLRRFLNRKYPEPAWLRPNGYNLNSMKKLIDYAVLNNYSHVEFMLHSSEFMAGGNPNFPDTRSVENLFIQMDEFFSYASTRCEGMTLNEFKKYYINAKQT